MSNCKVHNVRFYRPKPKAVYCMSLQPNENNLAVSRADASIEIWNLSSSPFIEKTLASSTNNYSVEGLSWCGSRLFSVGLHGLLIEYDLYKLCVKNRAVVTGEAAFCLDINKKENRIAIGTEQGYLNIFSIHENEVVFNKFLDKQEGRILCLKYDHTGEYIVSGGMDAIRIWNVSSGHALHKMTTGRSEARKPTIVWCLAVTENFTIISGDSRGKLTFWDGKIGAQVESCQSHRADILSLCLSKDETSLYCAGIDPVIINYVCIKVKDETHKWVKSVQRKIHDHDVRALVLNEEKLYSSGADGYLACSYHPPKTLLKYPPILQNPCVTACSKVQRLMLRYSKHLEIWSLGEYGSEKEAYTGLFQLKKEPKKLVVLQKVVKTDEGKDKKEGIICSAISDDGKYIAFSTRLGIRLFKFNYSEEQHDAKPELIPLEIPDQLDEAPCVSAIFSATNQLIVAPNAGGLQVFGLDKDVPFLIQNINTEKEISDTITHLCASGNYLVAADCQGNICVWNLKIDQYILHYKLPKLPSVPTALGIHPKLFNLVITYADNNVVEYDLKNRQLTKFSRSLTRNLPKQWMSRSYTIRNITFDPRADHIVILHDDSSIIIIDKEKKIPEADSKIPKVDLSHLSLDGSNGKMFKSYHHSFHSIKKYKHLVHLSWLSDDEMVAVEVNPLSLTEQLPACFVQNTFGRK